MSKRLSFTAVAVQDKSRSITQQVMFAESDKDERMDIHLESDLRSIRIDFLGPKDKEGKREVCDRLRINFMDLAQRLHHEWKGRAMDTKSIGAWRDDLKFN